MIESIRKENRSVLLLDGGEVFGDPMDRANAELHLKAMERMGYDALNLAGPELSFGREFLERGRSLISFPYIASNLRYEGGRLPWIQEYVVKEVGGIRVAILGILDPDEFRKISGQELAKGFEVMPPEAALGKLLPEVKGQADLVILLSQLGENSEIKIRELTRAVEGVDVVVFSEKNLIAPPAIRDIVFFHTDTDGTLVGVVTLKFDGNGKRSVSEIRAVQLGPSVPDHREMKALVEAYQKSGK